MLISKDVGQRIAMLRALMIFGIVLLHTPQYTAMNQIANTPFELIRAFFQLAFFRATVPVMSLISGFLLFSANLDLQPGLLYKKKIQTLVIPFFFFNIVLCCVIYAAQKMTGVNFWQSTAKMSRMEWFDALFAATHMPVNYPLHFLRDMFVVAMMAPVFGLFIRRAPLVGAIVTFVVFYNNLDGHLVERFTIPVFFYVGGVAGVWRMNLQRFDKYAIHLSVAFVVMCAVFVATRQMNNTPLVLVAPFMIWPASALLKGSRLGDWLKKNSEHSYFVFLTHAPVLTASFAVYKKFAHVIPMPVYWVVTPILTITFLIGLHKLLLKYVPTIINDMLGKQSRVGNKSSATGTRSQHLPVAN